MSVELKIAALNQEQNHQIISIELNFLPIKYPSLSKFSYPKFHLFSKSKNFPNLVKVLSPNQNGIDTFSSNIK